MAPSLFPSPPWPFSVSPNFFCCLFAFVGFRRFTLVSVGLFGISRRRFGCLAALAKGFEAGPWFWGPGGGLVLGVVWLGVFALGVVVCSAA